ncbi:MAG TPA: CopG family transcriptional regulator [Cyanobacteria bacterium UBA12227]|nr:CopG family transcriptional regulator [Cyanobacteria bacterium UBA12227]HAZ46531.1 CopG family transcriptional regulator [Cyanobacteria bacterium UBA11371]HBE47901.1 CopG family transcriptional regulator [Cyanobacteria bacterium UBA11369]
MSIRKNFRVSERESEILRLFCQQEDRTETDVVR